jgi:hypothetical protein
VSWICLQLVSELIVIKQRCIGRLPYTNAAFNHSINELLAACVVPDD